jgi:hypothetical protein
MMKGRRFWRMVGRLDDGHTVERGYWGFVSNSIKAAGENFSTYG